MSDYNMGSPNSWKWLFYCAAIGLVCTLVGVIALAVYIWRHIAWVP